jgi:hypothetical protein
MTDANERTTIMAKEICLQANATNASMSAATTPAATIEVAGTNTKAAGTNIKQFAYSSLQLHSLLDNGNMDGEHPAHKYCRMTMFSVQPSVPELCTRNNNVDSKHPACKHC